MLAVGYRGSSIARYSTYRYKSKNSAPLKGIWTGLRVCLRRRANGSYRTRVFTLCTINPRITHTCFACFPCSLACCLLVPGIQRDRTDSPRRLKTRGASPEAHVMMRRHFDYPCSDYLLTLRYFKLSRFIYIGTAFSESLRVDCQTALSRGDRRRYQWRFRQSGPIHYFMDLSH